jgi:NitT/TauT family transport system substrate-binding protein
MKSTRNMFRLLAAIAAIAALDPSARAQTLDKFQFRLNWTLYGEHAPFFVALDKAFTRRRGSRLKFWRVAAPPRLPNWSAT